MILTFGNGENVPSGDMGPFLCIVLLESESKNVQKEKVGIY